ncbi:TIGR03086 family metal-binding protein [Streptomyces daghestanicus]|uniref:TIGR03086 family protein n=1 Tax=Streptomyces daghestanicus TaxID=66885 RepID=A0ABQ3PTN9_9ACTN|nr:TIGR03086 family metal-binding protein [Streptomyces daghestanicus]GGU53627.1 TIGR03086 family protein [Streptomyces daghestanicus]GHI28377.1 TIGR03086 family protein [Streptomyces daghestanicus]
MTADPAPAVLDLGPQARIVARLAEGVDDARLADPTPCPELAVRDLLGHLTGLAVAFRDAARKDLGVTTDTRPDATVPDIGPGWRADLARALDGLTAAWQVPDAWSGMTRAGGIDLPGAVAAAVAAGELVVHGWDLARATGQEYAPDPAALRVAHGFLAAAAEEAGGGDGIFGPVVPVPADAPPLDRAVGLSGRDPSWTRSRPAGTPAR